MGDENLAMKATDPWIEIREISKRIGDSKEASPKDVERLRKLVAATPGALGEEFSGSESIRTQLVEKISYGASRAVILAEGDKLKKDLGYATAPPLEQLLIDHILLVRLRLAHVENAYNRQIVSQSVSLQVGAYWDNLLTSNQARFLRAIETLARVRRLSRNTPALQINIAREGGKQVNVQGKG
jgi:hypothetical protein